jgi:hypothetical protein
MYISIKGGDYIITGLRIRIYPNEYQEIQLFEWCKIYHNMWNFLVSKYKDEFPVISSHTIKGYSPRNLIDELKVAIPERVARGLIQTYIWSLQGYYDKLSNPPKFHKFNPNKQSFYISDTKWKLHDNYIYFPSPCGVGKKKSGVIYLDENCLNKYNIKKYNIKEIRDVRYTYFNKKWYISACFDIPDPPDVSQEKQFLGLDWGIKNFMTTSDGELINYPDSVSKEYQRIKKLQSIKDKKTKRK